MKKADLTQAIAEKIGSTKKEASVYLEALLEVVTEALIKGEEVNITGFGSFKTKERASRNGVNPRTGESIKIPAMRSPSFSAGKSLKDAVKK